MGKLISVISTGTWFYKLRWAFKSGLADAWHGCDSFPYSIGDRHRQCISVSQHYLALCVDVALEPMSTSASQLIRVNPRDKPLTTPALKCDLAYAIPLPCIWGECLITLLPWRMAPLGSRVQWEEETAGARLHLGHLPSEDWLSNGVFFLALNRHVSTLPACWLWQRERERQGRGAAMDPRCPLMQSNVATAGPLCLPADILLSVQLKGTFADVRRWCAWSWQFQHVGFQHWCL